MLLTHYFKLQLQNVTIKILTINTNRATKTMEVNKQKDWKTGHSPNCTKCFTVEHSDDLPHFISLKQQTAVNIYIWKSAPIQISYKSSHKNQTNNKCLKFCLEMEANCLDPAEIHKQRPVFLPCRFICFTGNTLSTRLVKINIYKIV